MIQITHGDTKVVLTDVIPDALITDPPYSAYVHANTTSCGTPGARRTDKAAGAAHRDMGFDHLGEELMTFVCQMAARTKRWSCIFTDTESVGQWRDGLERAGAHYIRAIPWIRWSMPALSGDRPPQGHEMIVLAWGSQKGKKHWNGPGNLTHFNQTCLRGKNKHKAQKPLDLMLELVEFFSDGPGPWVDPATGQVSPAIRTPADLVVDPCCGSGTTALACCALGRNFLGAELDGTWVEKARARLGIGPGGEEIPPVAMYDDEERFARYEAAAAVRAGEMQRMAANTARIVENRARHAAGGKDVVDDVAGDDVSGDDEYVEGEDVASPEHSTWTDPAGNPIELKETT